MLLTFRVLYKVEGAGTACCNGIYRMAPDVAENVPRSAYHSARMRAVGAHGISSVDEDDVPKYTFQAQGGPLLTLFRCRMRTKACWWFIRCEPELLENLSHFSSPAF